MANIPPVATINDHTLLRNQWAQASTWLSYTDANGNPARQYQFWDGGSAASSGYIYTSSNIHNPAGAAITVDATDLANVWIRGGSTGGAETMYVRAFDGADWGAWDSFTLTTAPNALPVATINDHSLATNHWVQLQNWLSYSDTNGDAVTQYQFWDGGSAGTSGYIYTSDNVHNAAGTAITVAASDLANVWLRGGSATGSETMYVRAFDGSDWGAWDSFTVATTANATPVATISDHSLLHDQWAQVSTWLGTTDADGDTVTRYQFWDSGASANSGYFWTPNEPHLAANTTLEVAASDLSNVWVRGGTTGGSETMWVRAFDGESWGSWDTFTLTTVPNTPPVATISDHSLLHEQWAQVSTWLSYSDANGDAATRYQFWDSGAAANSGYFWTPDDSHHAANSTLEVAASDLSNVWVRGGTAGGAETMWVRAFDGHDWGAWDTFTFTTVANTPPVATISDHSLAVSQWAQVSTWLGYSDANGDAATRYQFWDSGAAANSGYFWTQNEPHLAANSTLEVAAADLSNVWLRGGTASGAETLWVRAFDGHDWGAWDTFTLTTT